MPKPKVFICYARADNLKDLPRQQRWLDRVKEHLEPFAKRGEFELFSDRSIDYGDPWDDVIKANLLDATVAILLVSPAFLNSDYITNSELPVLLQKAKERKSRIIPLILSPCSFAEVEFRHPDPTKGPESRKLSLLQTGGTAFETLSELPTAEVDRIMVGVTKAVRKYCKEATAPIEDVPQIALEAPETPQNVPTALSTPGAGADTTQLPGNLPVANVSPSGGTLVKETDSDPSGLGTAPLIQASSGSETDRTLNMPSIWKSIPEPWRLGIGAALFLALVVLIISTLSHKTASERNRFTNSLGMVFVPVAGTQVRFCIWETRVRDYEAYALANGITNTEWKDSLFQGLRVTPTNTCPVVNVSWEDAKAFCAWLTQAERRAGKLATNQFYRLPTDLEWSAAAGLTGENGATPQERNQKVPGVYPWGTNWPPPPGSGNFADETAGKAFPKWKIIEGYLDGHATTSPVGTFRPLTNGIFDLSGNLWEWCEDWYDQKKTWRVLRGGSWNNVDLPALLLSSYRGNIEPSLRVNYVVGFRVVLATDESTIVTSDPFPAIAPGGADTSGPSSKAADSNSLVEPQVSSPPHGNTSVLSSTNSGSAGMARFTNSLGMVFVPVAGTQVRFCIWETRVLDYEVYALANGMTTTDWKDSLFQGLRVTPTNTCPVVNVSWENAKAFCKWLTQEERQTSKLATNQFYRLPTDLEWSAAVGLTGEDGATPQERNQKVPGVYPWGTSWPPPPDSGNFADETAGKAFPKWDIIDGYQDGYATTSPVGTYPPLKNGIFDLSGNVWEWCEDWYDEKKTDHLLRGGSWYYGNPSGLLSSGRRLIVPGKRFNFVGFRVVLAADEFARPGGL